MSLRKNGFLPQKIDAQGREKDRGQIGICAGMFSVLFLMVVLATLLQLEGYRFTGLYLEDALAASNLASAVIDIEEYGISHVIRLEDPETAYERFCMAIKGNLNLTDGWECPGHKLIAGKVEVEQYILYNVEEDRVFVIRKETDGFSETVGSLGTVTTPGGQVIEKTGIYSEISFPTEGIFGVNVRAHKGKLVDIARR